MADYPFKMNEFCCHGAWFLWQFQQFMNIGSLKDSLTVAMERITRFLLKITANLRYDMLLNLLCIMHE